MTPRATSRPAAPPRRTAPPAGPGKPVGARSADALLSDATPIYVRLILHFRQKIETGDWPVGERIPVLEELARELGVARATIRQAMGFLEREGLISRSRGRGTFVIRKPEHDLWYNIPNTWDALIEAANHMEDDARTLDPAVRAPGFSETRNGHWSADYEEIRQILKRDHVPYLIGTSHVHKRIVEELGDAARDRRQLYRFLGQSPAFRPEHTDQTVTIGQADAEIAYLLEVPLNAPIGIVERTVYDCDGIVVYHSEGIFRGDFIRLHRRLK